MFKDTSVADTTEGRQDAIMEDVVVQEEIEGREEVGLTSTPSRQVSTSSSTNSVSKTEPGYSSHQQILDMDLISVHDVASHALKSFLCKSRNVHQGRSKKKSMGGGRFIYVIYSGVNL